MPMDDFIICSLRKMAFGVAVVPNAKKWARKYTEGDMGIPNGRYQYTCTVGCCCPMTEHERTWFKLAGTDIRQTWSNVPDMKKNKRDYLVI
jgi:hypothetical protein